MAQLPLYHSTGGKLQYGGSRKSFSFRDRHLLLIILAVFAVICLGSLYYAPEVMEQVSFDTTYRKFIGLQDEANVIVSDDAVMDDQVSPSKMPSNIEKVDEGVVRNDADEVVDVQRDVAADSQTSEEERHYMDRQKDNVDLPMDQDEPVKLDPEEANKEESIVQPVSKDYVNVENRNSDPVVTQRREKVKEVRLYVLACSRDYNSVEMMRQ